MSTPETPKKSASKRASGMYKTFLIIASLILAVTIKTSFLFVLVFIIPSFVVYIVDRSPRMYLFKTVLCCNLTGITPHLGKLISQGNSSEAVWQMMQTPIIWLQIYLAAAMGWGLVAASPFVARWVMILATHNKVLYLQATQEKLVEEWGPEVQRRDALAKYLKPGTKTTKA